MGRIGFLKNTPDSLVEHVYFDYDMPHYLHSKNFDNPYHVPPHYSDSFEMMVFKNAKGQVTISGNNFSFNGNQVFVVPPDIVHSVFVEKCSGIMYVLKIQFDYLKKYLDIKNTAEYFGVSINELDFVCPEFDKIWDICNDFITSDDNIFSRIKNIAALFEILSRYKNKSSSDEINAFQSNNKALQKLIDWTNDNYKQNITLEQAAEVLHLSKYYFCRWFKTLTNLSYFHYLNSVRISHACKFIDNGLSVESTCYNCGYNSVSYFIQVFKKITGCTPKEFRKINK